VKLISPVSTGKNPVASKPKGTLAATAMQESLW